MPFQPARLGLHFEIMTLAATEDSSRSFLMTKQILKPTQNCDACNSPMVLSPCAASKSADLYIWKCGRPCKKTKHIRSGSVLSGSNLPFQHFLLLIYYFSSKSLTNVEISAYTGITEKSVGVWRAALIGFVSSWFLANATPLGGPGVIVEIDEAKFGKRKYHRGNYRAGMWVLGGVDRNTNQCFLISCPNNRRGAEVLLPLIERWVLPGSIVYTDEWGGYNQLTARGYTHDTVNHTIYTDKRVGYSLPVKLRFKYAFPYDASG